MRPVSRSGSVTHGHGWIAVLALVVVAGVSGVLSALGDIGSVTGLQLLVYTALGAGPIGALRPVWHTVVGFLIGVIWALILIVPGWLLSPHGKEQRDVAAVYSALAGVLRAIGTDDFTARRQQLTAALNTAYDELLDCLVHRRRPEQADLAAGRRAEREQPDGRGDDGARRGGHPAAAAGHRDGERWRTRSGTGPRRR